MTEVFVFEPDLMFSSKFEGFSRLTGLNFQIFALAEDLIQALDRKPQAIIVNLDLISSDILRRLTQTCSHILGYYSHVNSPTAKAALEMGVKYVVSRGAFVSDSASILQRLTQG